MTAMFRVTTVTTGYSGAPGYTNLFFIHSDPPSTGAQAAVTNVRAFWEAVAASFCQGWNYAIQSDVAVVEDTDGSISSFISTTPGTQSIFGNAGGYSAPSGLAIDWLTNGVVNNGHVQGRSFMVPLTGAAYQADGTLNSSEVTKFTNAGNALRTASGPTFCIWSRPFTPSVAHPGVARAGSSWPVTAVRVPDKAAVLRSRRD